MGESTLIRNGRIIDPASARDEQGDLLIRDGIIESIDKPGVIPDGGVDTILDAKGKWVTPGFVDVHVHLREPGQEYKETIQTGTESAVAGGFTSVACMANTNPVNDNAFVTAFIRLKAAEYGHCRVFPIGAVSKGLKGQELAEIGSMVKEGAVAISDDGMPVMNSYLMRKAMEYSKAFDIPVISHAEDFNLVNQGSMNESPTSVKLGLQGNPAAAEEIIVFREISLARLTGARVHIAHVSTKLAVDQIRRAKEEGLKVTAEVTPHHLVFSDKELRTYNTHFKMAPPLRSEEDVQCLREALASGVIDMIATDHAPHGSVDKDTEFDHACCGVLGLQTALPATLDFVRDGTISLNRWIESLTTAPARLINQDLGVLKIGAEADIQVFDPECKWSFNSENNQSKSMNSPWNDKEMTGRTLYTFVKGKCVYGQS